MKKLILFLGVIFLIGLSSCGPNNAGKVLLSRSFPTTSWERFDFVNADIEVKKATTYDLVLEASFDTTYSYDYLSVVFTIFDAYENPFRTKAYQFRLTVLGSRRLSMVVTISHSPSTTRFPSMNLACTTFS